jgi:uncharacterized protein
MQVAPRFMEGVSSQSRPPPLPTLADGKFHHVDPHAVPVGRIGMTITSLVLIGMAFVVLPFIVFRPDLLPGTRLAVWLGWGALFPLLGLYSWVWPKVSYLHTFYCLKEDCIIIRKGVFWKMETVVPKSRIQHIDVSQGPLQRSYAISDLIIHTAGTRFALVPLGGLSEAIAPQLRKHLLDRRDDDNTL